MVAHQTISTLPSNVDLDATVTVDGKTYPKSIKAIGREGQTSRVVFYIPPGVTKLEYGIAWDPSDNTTNTSGTVFASNVDGPIYVKPGEVKRFSIDLDPRGGEYAFNFRATGPDGRSPGWTYGLSILSPTISPPQLEPKPYTRKLATHSDERWLADFIADSPTAVSTNETVTFGRITFPHSIMSTLKEPATSRIVFDIPANRNEIRFDRAWNPGVYQTNHHGVIRAYHNGQLIDTMDVFPGLLQSKTLSVPGGGRVELELTAYTTYGSDPANLGWPYGLTVLSPRIAGAK